MHNVKFWQCGNASYILIAWISRRFQGCWADWVQFLTHCQVLVASNNTMVESNINKWWDYLVLVPAAACKRHVPLAQGAEQTFESQAYHRLHEQVRGLVVSAASNHQP